MNSKQDNGEITKRPVTSRRGRALLTLSMLLAPLAVTAADSGESYQSPPVAVTFGVQALTQEVAVNPALAFVSQMPVLPEVVCTQCTDQDSWVQQWDISPMRQDSENSRPEQGWFVFNSGLRGIGISIDAGKGDAWQPRREGMGARAEVNGELSVGLVRLDWQTAAGLAGLPASEFSRVTTFRAADGKVKYVQKDTLRVSADFRVPTCTSSASSLSLRLPDIDRRWLRDNVPAGHYAASSGSVPQLVLASCSENTRNLRIRFMPAGSVADSLAGPATILVGRDDRQQDSGVGFLMTYEATGFGQRQRGTVCWDRAHPLVLNNPQPTENNDGLRSVISLTLQAFYARPDNGLPLSSGEITAKGMYQVSYD